MPFEKYWSWVKIIAVALLGLFPITGTLLIVPHAYRWGHIPQLTLDEGAVSLFFLILALSVGLGLYLFLLFYALHWLDKCVVRIKNRQVLPQRKLLTVVLFVAVPVVVVSALAVGVVSKLSLNITWSLLLICLLFLAVLCFFTLLSCNDSPLTLKGLVFKGFCHVLPLFISCILVGGTFGFILGILEHDHAAFYKVLIFYTFFIAFFLTALLGLREWDQRVFLVFVGAIILVVASGTPVSQRLLGLWNLANVEHAQVAVTLESASLLETSHVGRRMKTDAASCAVFDGLYIVYAVGGSFVVADRASVDERLKQFYESNRHRLFFWKEYPRMDSIPLVSLKTESVLGFSPQKPPARADGQAKRTQSGGDSKVEEQGACSTSHEECSPPCLVPSVRNIPAH
ncbi:MAG: hypothetical protein SFU85_08860 [Candidatus Methylacidiphilales bacterium]|nr:hypothetical protein [Candidatus Methylacidiphilales bacterium]